MDKIAMEAELAERKAYGEKLLSLHEAMESRLQELNKTVEQFQQRYANEVGKKQNELNWLNAQISELRVKNTEYGSDVMHIKQDNKKSAVNTKYTRNNITFKTKAVSHAVQDYKETKRMYRKIASIIHPDKAMEVRSRTLRTKLMAELNEAYAQKDTMKMQHILDQWYESPEAVAGESIYAELERTERAIRLLDKGMSDIQSAISTIMTSDLYVMMVKVKKAHEEGRDLIAEMSIYLDTKIKEVQNILVLRMYG